MNAVTVASIYAFRQTRGNHVHFIVRVDFNLADGSVKSLRRHFPTPEIAKLVRDELAPRRDYLIECFNKRIEWQRSDAVNNAYREWIRTLSIEERLAFAGQKHSPSAELDPELSKIIEARRREEQQLKQANQIARRESKAATKQRQPKVPKPLNRIGSTCVCRHERGFRLEVYVHVNGKRTRLRRSYPTQEIAEQAKADLSGRQDHIIECAVTGVNWEDSQAVQAAVAEYQSTRRRVVDPVETAQQTAAKRQRHEEREKRRAEIAEAKRKRREQRENDRENRAAARRQREADRQRKRRQRIAALRQRPAQSAVASDRKRQRTPEEIQAEIQRGLAAKARAEQLKRERHLAAIERQVETQRAKELAKARKDQFRREKRAEDQRERQAAIQHKREIRLQIIERGIAERAERWQFKLDKNAGVSDFHGAEELLKFCESGLLTKDQARTLARLDADPEAILKALSQFQTQGASPNQSIEDTIQYLKRSYGSIPPDEDITRFSLRAACERCRRELFHVKSGDDAFGTYYGDDEDDWLTEDVERNAARSSLVCGF